RWSSGDTPSLVIGEIAPAPRFDGCFTDEHAMRAEFILPASLVLENDLALKPQVRVRSRKTVDERLQVRYAVLSSAPQYWAGYPSEDAWHVSVHRREPTNTLALSRWDWAAPAPGDTSET